MAAAAEVAALDGAEEFVAAEGAADVMVEAVLRAELELLLCLCLCCLVGDVLRLLDTLCAPFLEVLEPLVLLWVFCLLLCFFDWLLPLMLLLSDSMVTLPALLLLLLDMPYAPEGLDCGTDKGGGGLVKSTIGQDCVPWAGDV